jgi:hypothetical protein
LDFKKKKKKEKEKEKKKKKKMTFGIWYQSRWVGNGGI